MEKLFSTILVVLFLGTNIFAQSTVRLANGKSYQVEDLSSEFFRNKEKKQIRERNDRLRTQNARLEREIQGLEQRLDECVGNARSRYPQRRNRDYDFIDDRDLRGDFIGERRRLEKEYQTLKSEREYLQDQRDWLWKEIEACERRYEQRRYDQRDRYDYRTRGGKNRREPASTCSCHSCNDHYRDNHRSKGKGSQKSKGKGKKHGHHKHGCKHC